MKDQHTRMLHGRLLRPLKVGSSALIDHEGQFILTSLVTSIQVQNEQEAKFETLNTHYLRRFERSDYGYKGVSLCILRVVAHKLLSQRACCLKKLFGCQGTPCRRGQTVTGSGTGRAVWFGSPSFYNGHFLSKKQGVYL